MAVNNSVVDAPDMALFQFKVSAVIQDTMILWRPWAQPLDSVRSGVCLFFFLVPFQIFLFLNLNTKHLSFYGFI